MHVRTISEATAPAPTGAPATYDPTTNTNAAGTAAAGGGALTQDDFLNLLSTQLENQDPTNPESNTDFAAQMAQFSSLSEMNNLTSTMSSFAGVSQLASGSSLIGQSVTTSATDASGNAINGTVTGATVTKGELYLTVSGLQVPYSDVTSVTPASSATTAAAGSSGAGTSAMQSLMAKLPAPGQLSAIGPASPIRFHLP